MLLKQTASAYSTHVSPNMPPKSIPPWDVEGFAAMNLLNSPAPINFRPRERHHQKPTRNWLAPAGGGVPHLPLYLWSVRRAMFAWD